MNFFTHKLKKISWVQLDNLAFYSALALCIWPFLYNTYFVSLDGPAHLYNARLIKELWFNNPVNASQLYAFNEHWVPNWISHFVMAILFVFLPDYWVEKTWVLLYIFLGALLFRNIIKIVQPKNYFVSLLIIPLLPNALFFFGFYNFCFGFVAILLALYIYLKLRKKTSFLLFIALFFSFLILYFSHLYAFLLGLAIVLIFSFNFSKKVITKNSVVVLFAAIPALILTANYVLKIDSFSIADENNFTSLVQNIVNVRSLLGLCICEPWLFYSRLFGVALLVTLLFWSYFAIKEKHQWHLHQILLLLMVVVNLILYFVLPNSNLLTDRLLLSFFFLLVLTIATLKIPIYAQILIAFAGLSLELKYAKKLRKDLKFLSNKVEETREVIEAIPTDAFVLSFNFSENWLFQHSASYIGSANGAVVLDNYETSRAWFPLKYNTEVLQLNGLNTWGVKNQNIGESLYLKNNTRNFFGLDSLSGGVLPIKYVVKINSTDSIFKGFEYINQVLNTNYALKNQKGSTMLYELKKNYKK